MWKDDGKTDTLRWTHERTYRGKAIPLYKMWSKIHLKASPKET